ncbi:MAG TPA: carboxypeptidase-like regulatory domain-containing protein [Pyrinomonadaceae bacterium]
MMKSHLGVTSHKLFAIILSLSLLTGSLLAVPAHAQTTVTGAVEGQVLDDQGKPMPAGTVVRLVNEATQIQTAVKTNEEGRFKKFQLQPGTYTVVIEVPRFERYEQQKGVSIMNTLEVVPPIMLRRKAELAAQPTPAPTDVTATATPGPTPEAAASPAASPAQPPNPPAQPGTIEDIRATINHTDGRRSGSFSDKEVSTLPLGSVTLTRTFDELALFLPGVATPPQTQGEVAGPGVGAGVGSAGQFSVNGLRSRANNFTVDGSDNNDEDIGVRRQGFLALVPQPIESIKEYQVITLLAPAQYGRNIGAQVNAVSQSGTAAIHGTAFGFLNTSQLNARNFFDTTNGNAVSTLRANGQDVVIKTLSANCVSPVTDPGCVVLGTRPLTVRNGSGGKDSLTLAQAGFVLGGPLVAPDPANETSRGLFYFFSVEHLRLNANKEANFVVPTIAQRGIFNSGVTGVFCDPFFGPCDPNRRATGAAAVQGASSGANGSAIFSLYPFPNNPTGIYGANTFTRTLPAGGSGTIFSGKANGNFYVGQRRQEYTARYNFTDDGRTIPVTGGAIFSSLRPRVRTQNFSTFLNSEIRDTISNELRASYGRTRLFFDEVPDREFLIPSSTQFNDPRDARFLLNAPYLANFTQPNASGVANTGQVVFGERPFDPFGRRTTEGVIGLVGQVKIAGFSPLGVDVFNFPQSRINNTYQLADTLGASVGKHRFAFGADVRRIELNSDLPRNSRPLLIYGGVVGRDQVIDFRPIGANVQVPITPLDLVASGAPTGALQTLSTGGGSNINLRYYQYNFFGQDEWRVRPNLSLSYGLRYEYNTVPGERGRRIESTFNSPAIGTLLPGLRSFINGRTSIYDPERKNFAPRVGLAYSRHLFGNGRETVFRAGYGIFYDQIIGAVVSQSRNVFPSFLTLNFGGTIASDFALQLFNPALSGVCFGGDCVNRFVPLRAPGTLNQANIAGFGSLDRFAGFINQLFQTGGFGVTLPTRRLKTPMAEHYSFTVEQQLSRNMVLSAAYIGTQGHHLLRLTTPNAGENVQLFAFNFCVERECAGGTTNTPPQIFGFTFAPSFPSNPRPLRPNSDPALGAVNLIETSANSNYNALQVQLRGRFNSSRYTSGLLYQAAYTFGKVIDDVSDVFDVAGAPALPQDSELLNLERGPANFDVRHRFSYNVTYGLPAFANRSRAFRAVFGNLELASDGQFQTGQPFTVNSLFDVNGDGNLTDRLNSLNGLIRTGDRQQPLRFTGNTSSLLAPSFSNGSIGRNTFRASNLLLFNLAVVKNFAITERQKLTFRTEFLNLTNRANFGIPVRYLEALGFGQATDTVTPGRRVQFALKYSF